MALGEAASGAAGGGTPPPVGHEHPDFEKIIYELMQEHVVWGLSVTFFGVKTGVDLEGFPPRARQL